MRTRWPALAAVALAVAAADAQERMRPRAPRPAASAAGPTAAQNTAPNSLVRGLQSAQAATAERPTAAGPSTAAGPATAQQAAGPARQQGAPAAAGAPDDNPHRLGRPYPPPSAQQPLPTREPPGFYVSVVGRSESNVHQKIGRGRGRGSIGGGGTGNVPMAPSSVPLE